MARRLTLLTVFGSFPVLDLCFSSSNSPQAAILYSTGLLADCSFDADGGCAQCAMARKSWHHWRAAFHTRCTPGYYYLAVRIYPIGQNTFSSCITRLFTSLQCSALLGKCPGPEVGSAGSPGVLAAHAHVQRSCPLTFMVRGYVGNRSDCRHMLWGPSSIYFAASATWATEKRYIPFLF